jgi:tetratricopeptide (TPR) repeat protein
LAPKPIWAAAIAAFWLVPDQKLLRAKLVAVQALIVLAASLAARRGLRARAPGAGAPLDRPVAALALCAALFWALSPERAASEPEAVRLFFAALCYWAASRTGAGVPAAELWSAGAAAASAWALFEAARGTPRPFAGFGNPILLGVALASALPATLALIATARGPARPAWIAAGALQAAGLALSGSRAATFGLLAALGLWALARWSGRRLAAALAALGAAAGLGALLHAGREWTHGLIWRDGLALWAAKPGLGWGLGRFHIELAARASPELRARWPEGAFVVNFAHNEYLQTLVETGPLGLAALLAVPAGAWLLLRREDDPKRASLLAGALALFCAALVSPDFRLGATVFAAFALPAFARPAGERPSRGPAAAWAGAAAIALFAWLAARPLAAVRRNAAEAPFAARVDARSLGELEARLARTNSADDAEQLGYLRAKASDWAGAAAAFRRAAELDPRRPGPLNNLGNTAYMRGDLDGAVAWWEKSLAAAPDQLDARLNLAKLQCERGRLKECAAQLEEVLRRDPSNAKARVMYKKMVE